MRATWRRAEMRVMFWVYAILICGGLALCFAAGLWSR